MVRSLFYRKSGLSCSGIFGRINQKLPHRLKEQYTVIFRQAETLVVGHDNGHGLLMLFLHVLSEPFETGGQAMITQDRRAELRHQCPAIGQRIGQDVIDLLQDGFTGGHATCPPLALPDRQLADDQHLLQMIVQFGREALSLALLGQVQLPRQCAQAFLRLLQLGRLYIHRML